MTSAAHSISTTLSVAYSLVGFYVLAQLIILFRDGHRPFHYKSIFNWFALTWMAMRAAFWGLYAAEQLDALPTFATDLLFWAPEALIYLTFATLALFFLKVLWRREWRGVGRSRLLTVYVGVAVIDVGTTVAAAAMDAFSDDAAASALVVTLQGLEKALLFLFLSGVFAWIAWRLRYLERWEFNRMFQFAPRTIAFVMWALSFLLLTRGIFNALSSSGDFIPAFRIFQVDIDSDTLTTYFVVLGVYILWEFLPLLLLLSTIATGPRGIRGQGSAVTKEQLNYGVFRALAEMDLEAHEAGGGGRGSADADLASAIGLGGGGIGGDDGSRETRTSSRESGDENGFPMEAAKRAETAPSLSHSVSAMSTPALTSSGGLGISGGLVAGGRGGGSQLGLPGGLAVGNRGLLSSFAFGSAAVDADMGDMSPADSYHNLSGAHNHPGSANHSGPPPIHRDDQSDEDDDELHLLNEAARASGHRVGARAGGQGLWPGGLGRGVTSDGLDGGRPADGSKSSPAFSGAAGGQPHALSGGPLGGGLGLGGGINMLGGVGPASAAGGDSRGFGAAGGFLSAQHNAAKRTTYVPPSGAR